MALHAFPGLAWFEQPAGERTLQPTTVGALVSLAGNFLLFAMVSLLSRTRVSEYWQAGRFIAQYALPRPRNRALLAVKLEDLRLLAARFVGDERARLSFSRFAEQSGLTYHPAMNANSEWIAQTERLLAGVIGASSARAVVKAAIEGRDMQVDDVVRIADEASEVLEFNRALLQGAIENISQGLSVVDQSLRLVAWNQRYLELFDYPDGMIQVGRPSPRSSATTPCAASADRAIPTSTWPGGWSGCARASPTPRNAPFPMAG